MVFRGGYFKKYFPEIVERDENTEQATRLSGRLITHHWFHWFVVILSVLIPFALSFFVLVLKRDFFIPLFILVVSLDISVGFGVGLIIKSSQSRIQGALWFIRDLKSLPLPKKVFYWMISLPIYRKYFLVSLMILAYPMFVYAFFVSKGLNVATELCVVSVLLLLPIFTKYLMNSVRLMSCFCMETFYQFSDDQMSLYWEYLKVCLVVWFLGVVSFFFFFVFFFFVFSLVISSGSHKDGVGLWSQYIAYVIFIIIMDGVKKTFLIKSYQCAIRSVNRSINNI